MGVKVFRILCLVVSMIKNTRASPNNKKRATQSRSPLPVRRATFPVDDTTTKTNIHNVPMACARTLFVPTLRMCRGLHRPDGQCVAHTRNKTLTRKYLAKVRLLRPEG